MNYNYLNHHFDHQMYTDPSVNPCTNNLYNLPSDFSVIPPYTNRFVYVNQNFVNPTACTSILINPNFKKTVHINPNFKATAQVKAVIHVNPDVLKLKNQEIISKQVKNVEHKQEADPKMIPTCKELIQSSKIIVPESDASLKRKRRKSLQTTYKIIRSSKSEASKSEANSKKLCYMKTKFKIDKLVNKGCNEFTSVSKYHMLRKSLKVNGCKMSPYKSKLLTINGVLYKKTPNVLKKANLLTPEKIIRTGRKNKVWRIGSNIFKLDSNKTLLRINLKEKDAIKGNSRKIEMGGKTFTRKEPNIYSKTNNNNNKCLFLRKIVKSIPISANKLRKYNVPCPVYKRFGKCKGKENATCIFVHNPNQVNLCTRFLQGACINKNCLLSHKVSAEKMPTCKYFLEGLCFKEDCPYIHVKISPKADICKDFLEGFCKKGKECDKRHQFMCPDFEKSGKCVRRRCPYPHGKMVRKFIKPTNKVAKKTVRNRTTTSEFNNALIEQSEINCRYYEDKEKVNCADVSISVANENRIETNKLGSDNKLIALASKNRPKLGSLPSFIPLGQSSSE